MSKVVSFVTLIWASLSVVKAEGIDVVHSALQATGRHHIELTVGAPDNRSIVPVTVINGPSSGPTLLVLAGIHGSEYSPILATQRLAVTIDPAEVKGALILVHTANVPAFLGRTIYTSPADGKNLNRLFPGNKNGSLSERIAYLLTNHLYPLADVVLDMHSGDGNEDLKPFWTGYYGKAGSHEVIDKSRAMALAFGLEHIIEFQWELSDVRAAIWAGSAAIALGIPSIDVEAGGRGVIEEDAISAIESGVMRVMSHLGMVDAQFEPPENQKRLFNREYIKAPSAGSWIPLKPAGVQVQKGEILGYMTDLFGRRSFEARAPKSGILMLVLSAPPVRRDETLAIIADVETLSD